MYKIFVFLVQLILLISILTFIFSNPFVISFDIENLKYSFSSSFLIGIFFVILFFIYIITYAYFKSSIALSKYFLKKKYKKLEKGYYYFIEAMIAIANKDNKNASRSHKKMNSYIKNDPSLSLLLKSEVYKIEKKIPELTNVYEEMLKSKKTETLGFRGLMEQNLANQDYHHAFLYGEKLFSINPNIEKLYDTLIYIAAKTKNWNQLIMLSDKAYSKKIIDLELSNENKSIGFFEIAKIKSYSDINESIKNITKAINLKKNFPPYIKLHLELISNSQNIVTLKKMLKKYWIQSSNSIMRSILIKIIIDNKLDSLDFIHKLIKNNYDDVESKKMLIFFLIRKEKWEIARENLKGLIGSNPSREVCKFMSEIEFGDKNDIQKRDAWIKRSETAPLENTWICKITNKHQDEWSTVSNSGYFNSLVLSTPIMINQITN